MSTRFLNAIRGFNSKVRLPDQERMYELAAKQMKRERDLRQPRDDQAFAGTLKDATTGEEHARVRRLSDRNLFDRLAYLRDSSAKPWNGRKATAHSRRTCRGWRSRSSRVQRINLTMR